MNTWPEVQSTEMALGKNGRWSPLVDGGHQRHLIVCPSPVRHVTYHTNQTTSVAYYNVTTVYLDCAARCNFSGRSVCFFFLSTRLLSNGYMIFTKSPRKDVFTVLFINDRTPWKSAHRKQIGGSKRPLFKRKFRLRRLRTDAARKRGGILEKLKQLV